ncbi:MAG: gephyrin-like molybdotransferase Glp [Bacillota bacterium]
MIEVEQAIGLLTASVAEIAQPESVPLLDALGRVLIEEVLSPIGVPRFPKAAMDGYALFSADSTKASRERPVRLQVVCELDAGDAYPCDCAPFTAARIMTGGTVPEGYDCVIKQEDSDRGAPYVSIYKALSPQENYVAAGEDIREGQLVFQSHTRLTCDHIGVLASMGFARVTVLRPFRVGLIATGNELARPGEPLDPAQVYDSNSYLLASYLKSAGVELTTFEICRDEPELFEALVEEGIAKADFLITTGGVSVGRRDIVASSLEALGATPLFARVNMKPGTPVLAKLYRGKPVLCLSGSPFAAVANFHVFFWPALAKAMGCPDLNYARKSAVLREGFMKPSGLRRFVRAHLKDDGAYLYTRDHRASVLSNLPGSNCLIDQPANTPLSPGDTVELLCPRI